MRLFGTRMIYKFIIIYILYLDRQFHFHYIHYCMCKEKIRHYCCRLSLHGNFQLIENTHWCLKKYRNSRHKQFRKVYKLFFFFRKVIWGFVIDVWRYKETVGINNRSLGRCKCFPIFEIGNLQVLVEVLYPFKSYFPKTKTSIDLGKQSISRISIAQVHKKDS
jgi:hypothetical protein